MVEAAKNFKVKKIKIDEITPKKTIRRRLEKEKIRRVKKITLKIIKTKNFRRTIIKTCIK